MRRVSRGFQVSERTVYLSDLRANRRGWSRQEVSHFRRAVNALWGAGLSLETDSGVTDEGDPWFVFCDAESGEVFVHFARLNGTYVVCAPLLNGSLTGRVLSELVERFVDRCVGRPAAFVGSRFTPAAG
jgi:hypothetical protein